MEIQHKADVRSVFVKAKRNFKIAALLVREREEPHIGCATGHGATKSGPSDLALLARALIVVERFATSDLERLGERYAVFGLTSVGLSAPDFSLGVGQIKVSSLKEALNSGYVIDIGRAEDLSDNSNELARQLFDPCIAHMAAELLVAKFVQLQRRGSKNFVRDDIVSIAAAYNGQSRESSLEGALSGAIYNELVYQIFLMYKFESLQDRAPAALDGMSPSFKMDGTGGAAQ